MPKMPLREIEKKIESLENKINVQFTYDFDTVKTFVRYAPDIETLARMILGFYQAMNDDIGNGIFVTPDLEECLRASAILWRKYR